MKIGDMVKKVRARRADFVGLIIEKGVAGIGRHAETDQRFLVRWAKNGSARPGDAWEVAFSLEVVSESR